MIYRALSIVLVLFFLLCGHGFSEQPETLSALFKKANQAYLNGRYDEAIKFYKEIIGQGHENGYVYYNLANAYFKLNQLGYSIFYYRAASLYIPLDENLAFNLQYAREKVVDKIESDENKAFLSQAISKLFFFNQRQSVFFVATASCLFWGICAVALFYQGEIMKRLRVIFLAVFLLSLTVFIGRQWLIKPFGVAIAKETQVYSGVGKDNVVLFVLHEGVEFTVEDSYEENWIKIELVDGKKGWMAKADAAVWISQIVF